MFIIYLHLHIDVSMYFSYFVIQKTSAGIWTGISMKL